LEIGFPAALKSGDFSNYSRIAKPQPKTSGRLAELRIGSSGHRFIGNQNMTAETQRRGEIFGDKSTKAKAKTGKGPEDREQPRGKSHSKGAITTYAKAACALTSTTHNTGGGA
jgi:hypothetical protein